MKHYLFAKPCWPWPSRVALLLGGCAALQEDGGRDFEPTLAGRRRRRAEGASPAPSMPGHGRAAVEQRHRAQRRRHAHDPARRKTPRREKKSTTTRDQVHDRPSSPARPSPAGRSRSTARRSSRGASATNRSSRATAPATQSNKLDGSITVTVAKRFSNGNLLVRGQKWIGHQLRTRIRAPAGHRAPERHRAGQQRVVVPRRRRLHLVRRAGHAWRMPPSPAGCTASSLHRRRRSEQDRTHATPSATIPAFEQLNLVRRHRWLRCC